MRNGMIMQLPVMDTLGPDYHSHYPAMELFNWHNQQSICRCFGTDCKSYDVDEAYG